MPNVNSHNDELLWKSFLEGSNDSLEMIYRNYFDELYQYGNKWLNNPTFTEDVIQELFIKLIRTRQNLSEVRAIKYYLFRAFRTLALDKLKADKKVMRIYDAGEHMFRMELTPEHSMIDKQEYHHIKIKLEAALSELTPRQREALFLMYSEGFSYNEVAEMMGLTIKGTYKLMARAIQALKDVMVVSLLIEILTHNSL